MQCFLAGVLKRRGWSQTEKRRARERKKEDKGEESGRGGVRKERGRSPEGEESGRKGGGERNKTDLDRR